MASLESFKGLRHPSDQDQEKCPPTQKLKKEVCLTRIFFISILFISIIRLRSGKNKHNLSITKAQILPHDDLKNEENQS